MHDYLYFDNASTTKCCEAATQLLMHFAQQEFGNPSSAHRLGQGSAQAIREARRVFADTFHAAPEQIIFTGSGTESDNLAIIGTAFHQLHRKSPKAPILDDSSPEPIRILISATEHPAVRNSAESLRSFGIDVQTIPVQKEGQINLDSLFGLLTAKTTLISIQTVNNITGALLPVEQIAAQIKARFPQIIFHTDAVQAFGKVRMPTPSSSIDLVSISGHKICGPKGVGALIVLNKKLLKAGLQPLIWGGGQENGFRSGTQSPGLIAAFAAAAKQACSAREKNYTHVMALHSRLKELLIQKGLLKEKSSDSIVHWNSPTIHQNGAIPHIINLSVPGLPSGPLSRLLEERGCMVATGSACDSQRSGPDPVLTAMGISPEIASSALRISFSKDNHPEQIDLLVQTLKDSIQTMSKLYSKALHRKLQP